MEHKRILELALEALEKQKTLVETEVEALRAEMRGSGRAILKTKTATHRKSARQAKG